MQQVYPVHIANVNGQWYYDDEITEQPYPMPEDVIEEEI